MHKLSWQCSQKEEKMTPKEEKSWIWAYFFFFKNQGNNTSNPVIHAKWKYFLSDVYEKFIFTA